MEKTGEYNITPVLKNKRGQCQGRYFGVIRGFYIFHIGCGHEWDLVFVPV